MSKLIHSNSYDIAVPVKLVVAGEDIAASPIIGTSIPILRRKIDKR